MFPSSNSINPSFHFSPSKVLHSPPLPSQDENNNIFLPQHNYEIPLIPKKRTKRKDRHSKIYTAHGLRDRRVRLSVDTARKFFKLQDILRFDKASQTICWLLKGSESSIKELEETQCLNQDGFENVSPISELSELELGSESMRNTLLKSKEKKINTQCMPSFYGLGRRESRARARVRAKERTREKKLCAQKIGELNHPISNGSNSLVSGEGMVDDVMKGSPSKSENPLTAHKYWEENNFAEFEVFSKYFEACNH